MRDRTDFKDNAIGIDPRGCCCTDCVVGNSVPFSNKVAVKTIARQALRGRRVINRSSIPLVLVWNREDIIEVPEDAVDRWRFSKDQIQRVSWGQLMGQRPLPIHRTEAGYPYCSTCDGGGCPDCTDQA